MDTTRLASAVLAGILLGAFYFGGLWWTIRRMAQARHPLNLYFGSLGARLLVVLSVFYWIAVRYQWPEIMGAFVGFLLIRTVMIQFVGRASSLAPPARDAAP